MNNCHDHECPCLDKQVLQLHLSKWECIPEWIFLLIAKHVHIKQVSLGECGQVCEFATCELRIQISACQQEQNGPKFV